MATSSIPQAAPNSRVNGASRASSGGAPVHPGEHPRDEYPRKPNGSEAPAMRTTTAAVSPPAKPKTARAKAPGKLVQPINHLEHLIPPILQRSLLLTARLKREIADGEAEVLRLRDKLSEMGGEPFPVAYYEIGLEILKLEESILRKKGAVSRLEPQCSSDLYDISCGFEPRRGPRGEKIPLQNCPHCLLIKSGRLWEHDRNDTPWSRRTRQSSAIGQHTIKLDADIHGHGFSMVMNDVRMLLTQPHRLAYDERFIEKPARKPSAAQPKKRARVRGSEKRNVGSTSITVN